MELELTKGSSYKLQLCGIGNITGVYQGLYYSKTESRLYAAFDFAANRSFIEPGKIQKVEAA